MMPTTLAKPLSGQLAGLIEVARSRGQPLEAMLADNGFSYEDLRYETSPRPPPLPGVGHPTLADFRQPRHGTQVVSFFSGCGGLDLGFEAAGFDHVCLIEHVEVFCRTLRKNRPWKVLGPPHGDGDISQRRKLSRQLEGLGLRSPFAGVFVGGPPCQPFSIAANQRFAKAGDNFKRIGFDNPTNGNLLFDYVWFIRKYLPRAFLIENVPGLAEVDGGQQLAKACRSLAKSGYAIHPPLKINAACYGVPQQRERLFIVGCLGGGEFAPPRPEPVAAQPMPCLGALLGIDERCPNHVTRKHKAASVARYVKLKVGQRDHLGRVDRLNPGLPSKTVIAGGTSGGGRSHLHPYIPRTLSVRECARLQTFPDDYVFTGPVARQFTQVGNAVPPLLGAQLAAAIYRSFFAPSPR